MKKILFFSIFTAIFLPIFYTFGQNLQICSQNDVTCLITNLIKIILQSNKSLDINQLTAQIASLKTTVPPTTSMSTITPIKILYPMENSILTVGKPVIIKWLDLDRKLKTFNIYLCTEKCNFIAISDNRVTSTLFTPTKLHESKSAFIRFKIFYPNEGKSAIVDSPKFTIAALPSKPTTSDQQIDNFYIKASVMPITTEFYSTQDENVYKIEANNFVLIKWIIVDSKGNVVDPNSNPPNIPVNETIGIGVCINEKSADMTSHVHCKSIGLGNDTTTMKSGRHFVYIPSGYEKKYIQFYISYKPNPNIGYYKSVEVKPVLFVEWNSIFGDIGFEDAARIEGTPQLCIIDNRIDNLFCKELTDIEFYDPISIYEYLAKSNYNIVPNETTKITVKIPGVKNKPTITITGKERTANFFTSPMPLIRK